MTDKNAGSGDPGASENDPAHGLASRFPTAYTILFLLIIFVAALTWIIPAGQYDRVMNEEIGREVAVAGTFKTVEANPQGFVEVMLAPVAGFYDPDSYEANAIDVALFVLFLGGFLGVVNATGAIDAGIKTAMTAMKGREIWMIPIMMSLFALGGTTYGMAEETLAFYAILIPVMIAAGYDAVTGVAIILVGHVTKEGALAGPRVLEHMVDTVLYFEGDTHSSFRLVRAIHHRFGAVNEIGVFAMTEKDRKSVV